MSEGRHAVIAVFTTTLLLVQSALTAQQDLRDRAYEHLAQVEQAIRERQGPQGPMWRERIQSNASDLERSLDWLVAHGDGEAALRFADAMSVFWTAAGELPHARQRLGEALALPGASAPTALRAKALYDAGVLAFRQNDETASRLLNEESLAIGRRLNDSAATATALVGLSRLALRHHDYAAVKRDAGEALRLRQAMGDETGEVSAVHMLAASARMEDDAASAAKFYELTLGIYAKNGSKSGVAGELMNLGFVHVHQHDSAWAVRLFTESVSMYRALGAEDGLAFNISGLAAAAAERHDAETAARLYGALDAEMKKLGIVLDPDDELDYQRYTAMARTQIGPAGFDRLRDEGRKLSVDGALALGLGTR